MIICHRLISQFSIQRARQIREHEVDLVKHEYLFTCARQSLYNTMSCVRGVCCLMFLAAVVMLVAADDDFKVGKSEVKVAAKSGMMEFRRERRNKANETVQTRPVQIRMAQMVQLDKDGNEVANCTAPEKPVTRRRRRSSGQRNTQRKKPGSAPATGGTGQKGSGSRPSGKGGQQGSRSGSGGKGGKPGSAPATGGIGQKSTESGPGGMGGQQGSGSGHGGMGGQQESGSGHGGMGGQEGSESGHGGIGGQQGSGSGHGGMGGQQGSGSGHGGIGGQQGSGSGQGGMGGQEGSGSGYGGMRGNPGSGAGKGGMGGDKGSESERTVGFKRPHRPWAEKNGTGPGKRFSNFNHTQFNIGQKKRNVRLSHSRSLKALVKRFHANLGAEVGNLAIDMALPENDGEIDIDGEKQKLKKGDLKFNIELTEWNWCGDEGEDGAAAFLDVYIEVNSTQRPKMRRGRSASAPASFNLGDNTTMSFSGKVRIKNISTR